MWKGVQDDKGSIRGEMVIARAETQSERLITVHMERMECSYG